jgi:heterodisulfide reductase subunit C
LAHIIFTATGEDVRQCTLCELCGYVTETGEESSIGELIQAAARDDTSVLESEALWNCDHLLERNLRCQAGIDITSVVLVLRDEAQRRGYVH